MAEMNALVVRDAEEYYRTMMAEDTKSWNLRCVGYLRQDQSKSSMLSCTGMITSLVCL